MKNPYTYNEIKGILKALGLTQSWIASKTHCSRQNFTKYGAISEDSESSKRYRLFCTYVLDDYMENELHLEPERIDSLRKAITQFQEELVQVRKAL